MGVILGIPLFLFVGFLQSPLEFFFYFIPEMAKLIIGAI